MFPCLQKQLVKLISLCFALMISGQGQDWFVPWHRAHSPAWDRHAEMICSLDLFFPWARRRRWRDRVSSSSRPGRVTSAVTSFEQIFYLNFAGMSEGLKTTQRENFNSRTLRPASQEMPPKYCVPPASILTGSDGLARASGVTHPPVPLDKYLPLRRAMAT